MPISQSVAGVSVAPLRDEGAPLTGAELVRANPYRP